jgi:ribonuclease HI
LNTIDIYTDGGCHGISGIGGWAAMIYDGPRPVEISGYETDTTNQKMELRAAIEGLEYLEQPSQVRLYSDSAYLINGMNQRWHLKWEQNGWKTANRKPVKNAKLWKELVELSRFHTVTWMKVRGHAGIPANERCDALVRLEMARGLD